MDNVVEFRLAKLEESSASSRDKIHQHASVIQNHEFSIESMKEQSTEIKNGLGDIRADIKQMREEMLKNKYVATFLMGIIVIAPEIIPQFIKMVLK